MRLKHQSPKDIVSLTGGLGNQLFQLAVAVDISNGNHIELEWGVGKPRLSSNGLPEISAFELPENISLSRKRRGGRLMAKSSGYLLRMGIDPRWYEKVSYIRRFIAASAEFISFFYFWEKREMSYSTGTGYSQIEDKSNRRFHVGYFQSFRWASNPSTYSIMSKLRLKEYPPEYEDYKELALVEKPLIVHVRLGDYKNEADFGLLHPKYFAEVLNERWASGKFNKIWVFSDEISTAEKYFKGFQQKNLRYIQDVGKSTSVTFEVMRLGYGYIIGNSSFSWWSAFLSRNSNVLVTSPSPWFRNLPEPVDLFPSNWSQCESRWMESLDTIK
jgi:hypothetical protein